MSEINDRKAETIAEEAVQETVAEPQEQETVQVPAEKAKKKKKRKAAKLALPIVAVLLVIALAFGAVVGYIAGRNSMVDRLQQAEKQLAVLTQAFEEEAGTPVYDAFTEELTDENRTALEELSGVQADDGVEDILGEEALGQVLETGEEQAPVVVAEFEGGTLMSDEVAREYEDQMASLLFAGYSEEEVAEVLLEQVMTYMVGDRILMQKAQEMGLYDLSDADREQIAKEAETIYNEQLSFYSDYVNTEGMTEAEATGAVKSYLLESEGVTLEGLRSDLEAGWWMEKLYQEIIKDVQVSDAEIRQSYQQLLSEQKESFTVYVDDYEFAQMNGDPILYNLDGYRAVRMLLFAFENPEDYEAVLALSDELAELDPVKDADQIAEYVAEINACYASVDAEALDALNRLSAGADFEQLIAERGDDSGMSDDDLRSTGYYVSRDSLLWPREFIDAAMDLQNPGDLSGAVRIADGVCILQYVGDVPAGEVAFESVQDQLKDMALANAQFNAYEAQMNEWIQQADVKYYPERMQ